MKKLIVIATIAFALITNNSALAQSATQIQEIKRCLGGRSDAATIRRCMPPGITLPDSAITALKGCLATLGFDICAAALKAYLPSGGGTRGRTRGTSGRTGSSRYATTKQLKDGTRCILKKLGVGRHPKLAQFKRCLGTNTTVASRTSTISRCFSRVGISHSRRSRPVRAIRRCIRAGRNCDSLITRYLPRTRAPSASASAIKAAAQACATKHKLNVDPQKIANCLSVIKPNKRGIKGCLQMWWNHKGKRARARPDITLPKARLNLHMQENLTYMGLSFGALMLPGAQKDSKVWMPDFGIHWQRVHYNLTHIATFRFAVTEANQTIGGRYHVGFGPSHGILHLGFTVGFKFIHLFHKEAENNQEKEFHTFGFGYSLGGFIDVTPLIFYGKFWEGVFNPAKLANRKLTSSVVAGILENFRLRLWVNWEAAILGLPNGLEYKAGGVSFGLSISFLIHRG